MRRPGIAIDTAVLTSAIRVDARLEADVGAVVLGDDGARPVGQVLRPRPIQGVEVFLVLLDLLELQLVVRGLESIGRVEPGPASLRRRRIGSTHGSLPSGLEPRSTGTDLGPNRHTIHAIKSRDQCPLSGPAGFAGRDRSVEASWSRRLDRVDDATHEDDAARAGVADQVEERMVDRRRPAACPRRRRRRLMYLRGGRGLDPCSLTSM